jgi:hypothetical protein
VPPPPVPPQGGCPPPHGAYGHLCAGHLALPLQVRPAALQKSGGLIVPVAFQGCPVGGRPGGQHGEESIHGACKHGLVLKGRHGGSTGSSGGLWGGRGCLCWSALCARTAGEAPGGSAGGGGRGHSSTSSATATRPTPFYCCCFILTTTTTAAATAAASSALPGAAARPPKHYAHAQRHHGILHQLPKGGGALIAQGVKVVPQVTGCASGVDPRGSLQHIQPGAGGDVNHHRGAGGGGGGGGGVGQPQWGHPAPPRPRPQHATN